MKTYKELMERAFSARGQAAREKMRSQEGLNAARKAADRQQQAAKVGIKTPSQQKALPPGKSSAIKPSPGGSLSTKPADKGSAIVRAKQPATDGPGPKPNRKPSPSPQRSNSVDQTTARAGEGGAITPYKKPEPESKPKKPGKPEKHKPGWLEKQIRKTPGRIGNLAKKGFNNTVTDGQPESSRGSIEPPKRGVYNG